MARRADSGIPVSFFSFQDIITCISGIMIFVVLLLVLDTTTGALSQGRMRPQTSAGRTADEVRNAAAAVRAELAQVEKQAAQLAAQCAKAADADRAKIAEEAARLDKEIRRMEGDLRGAEASGDTKELSFQKARKRARELDGEIREVAMAKRALEAASRKRVVFALPETDMNRNVLILECSGSRLMVGVLNPNGMRVLSRLERKGTDISQAVRDALGADHPAGNNVSFRQACMNRTGVIGYALRRFQTAEDTHGTNGSSGDAS
jgi:hypothetical protein